MSPHKRHKRLLMMHRPIVDDDGRTAHLWSAIPPTALLVWDTWQAIGLAAIRRHGGLRLMAQRDRDTRRELGRAARRHQRDRRRAPPLEPVTVHIIPPRPGPWCARCGETDLHAGVVRMPALSDCIGCLKGVARSPSRARRRARLHARHLRGGEYA